MTAQDSRSIRLATGERAEVLVRQGAPGVSRCLLLHGNPDDMHAWAQVIEALGPKLEVAALDLPGFGLSSREGSSPDSVGLNRMAACCVALADALEWNEPFFIAGHSHGAGVAQVVAAKHPTRVAGLVLISSLGVRPHATYRLLALAPTVVFRWAGWLLRSERLRFAAKWVLRRVMRQIWSPQEPPQQRVEQEVLRLARRTEVLVTMAHVAKGNPCKQLLQLLPELHCPVLIVHGDRDALVPFKHARQLSDAMSAAGNRNRLECLQGVGHAVLECQPGEIAQRIEGFVASVAVY